MRHGSSLGSGLRRSSLCNQERGVKWLGERIAHPFRRVFCRWDHLFNLGQLRFLINLVLINLVAAGVAEVVIQAHF